MIEITNRAILPEAIIAKLKSDGSGCVVTYIGLIRDRSHGEPVLSVEYRDGKGNSGSILQVIATDAKSKWQVENIAISHRIGKLKVGEINQVVAVAFAHRNEGFAACQYIIDQLKERSPTRKVETYKNGNVVVQEAFCEAVK